MADLRDGSPPAPTIAEAREGGAVELWAYGHGLDEHGFEPAPGYARLHAERPAPGEPLVETEDLDAIVALLERCYVDLWGHWLPDRALVAQTVERPHVRHLVLGEEGICRVNLSERLIDAPGLVPEARTPERYAQLVAGAAALLGDGPADLESWGDAPETIRAYEALGFRIEVRLQGWRLLT
jgi:hypothetical protein